MKLKIVAFTLMVILPCYGSNLGSSRKTKSIELVATNSGSTVVTIHVSDNSLLYEFNEKSEAVIFGPDTLISINNKEKTYRVQSYLEVEKEAQKKASEIATARKASDTRSGVELRLSSETGTIDGHKVRKLVQLNNGKHEGELWVSSELSPPGLRKFGEKMRSILPEDYWGKVHGNPGLIEIVTLFGVPLKASRNGQSIFQARISESSMPESSFEVPGNYRKLGN